jgi:sensor domain CHASE-containing protein
MILLYFLVVFVFFLTIMQWLFLKIDARRALSAAAPGESRLSTEQRANTP